MMVTQVGPYEALRRLGGGGITTVYEATDRESGRTVALKLVSLPQDVTPAQRQELLGRWRREVQAIARLSHPNIVAVSDVGAQDGQDYLVMEYLPGRSLARVLENGPLRAGEAARLLEQVAAAVDAVHAQGLVLRCLKPSKVMVLPDGVAKLTSLGLARHADDTMVTQAGERVGSPLFMAPEQARGKPATPASDIWALGALLYMMLAGRPPFEGPTVEAVLHFITSDPPPPVPWLPPPLAAVVTRALLKDPSRRYPSAGALAAAVNAAVAPPPPASTAETSDAAPRRLLQSPLVWAAPLVLVTGVLAAAMLRPTAHRPAAPSSSLPPVVAARAPVLPNAHASAPKQAKPRVGAKTVRHRRHHRRRHRHHRRRR